MELGVGYALTSFLDAKGVPGMAQQTAVICPQSLMGPVDSVERLKLIASDGMDKYDDGVDNISAYEVLTEQSALEAERAQLEKEKAEFQKQKEKEEVAAAKKKEKEKEAAEKKKERAAERRKAQIERSLINTSAQVLKRGLFNTLFK